MNLFFSFAAGNVVRLDPVFSDTYSDINALPNDFKNRWVKSGDELKTNVPSIADQLTASMELGNAYRITTTTTRTSGWPRAISSA